LEIGPLIHPDYQKKQIVERGRYLDPQIRFVPWPPTADCASDLVLAVELHLSELSSFRQNCALIEHACSISAQIRDDSRTVPFPQQITFNALERKGR
jgi:hypothetical protein